MIVTYTMFVFVAIKNNYLYIKLSCFEIMRNVFIKLTQKPTHHKQKIIKIYREGKEKQKF